MEAERDGLEVVRAFSPEKKFKLAATSFEFSSPQTRSRSCNPKLSALCFLIPMGSNQSLNDVHLDAVDPPIEVISSKYVSSLPTTVMHLKFHCLKRPGSVDVVDINSSDTEKLFRITVGEGGDKVVADAEGNAGEPLKCLSRTCLHERRK